MATAAAPKFWNRRSAPCVWSVWNRRSAPYMGTADRGGLKLAQYKTPRALKDAPFFSYRLTSPRDQLPPPLRSQNLCRRRTRPLPPHKSAGGGSGGGHLSIAEALARWWFQDSVPSCGGDCKVQEGVLLLDKSFFLTEPGHTRRLRTLRIQVSNKLLRSLSPSLMPPIKLTSKRTYADITKTTRPPRFKDFDEIGYGDTFPTKWSIHVRVEVKYLPNKYGDNICFILMDKTGAKLEASVWGFAEVERFNRILQPGCYYTTHRVGFGHNAEGVEFRHIGHLFECHFDRNTVVEPSPPIEFPKLPKHLVPFWEVAERPNKTFVDIFGIVVHCCELEHSGMYGKYREVIFMDAWGRLIAVVIWGHKFIENSYLWSTAEGGNPIVISTMLEKDIKFGELNTSDHTKFAFNPTHRALCPLQDIRQKIISGEIDMTFVRRFLERRRTFVATVLAKRDARNKK